MKHSERNAIDHSKEEELPGSTIYVTGKPCEDCMLDIVANGILKVVYFADESRYDKDSMCIKPEMHDKTDEIAELGDVMLVPFRGDLSWLFLWTEHLADMGIYKI
jgi:deoxycytidylate deaminase